METYEEKRAHKREAYEGPIHFTVLLTQTSEFRRVQTNGKIIDSSRSGLGIVTDFPLEAGHVLEWDDSHQKGRLHIAMVRWSQQLDSSCRAGLMFI